MAERGRADAELATVHRTRRAVSDATGALRTLGLHEMAPAGGGGMRPAALDPAQRRALLIFMSTLEEHVKALEGYTADLAREIETRDRRFQAAATYQRTGKTIQRFSRPDRPTGRKVKQ